jgi:K+ transporter
MIQRIQTIFLLMALVLTGLFIWLPLGAIAVNEKIYTFVLKGIIDTSSGQTIYSAWHLIAITTVVLLLQLIVIFTFKKRSKQIRMATVNILLMLGVVIASCLFVVFTAKSMGNAVYSLKITLALPLVSVFLNYLAIKAIQRDEALVKSVDRIR